MDEIEEDAIGISGTSATGAGRNRGTREAVRDEADAEASEDEDAAGEADPKSARG